MQALLTAESETLQKLWQMQMVERQTKWQKVQSPTRQQREWLGLGFWSVDGKNVEPRDKVVCKLCKLQLAYHSTTSNTRAHLENVHPNEHAMMSGTPTKHPRLNSYVSPPATSSLSAARQEACMKKLACSYART